MFEEKIVWHEVTIRKLTTKEINKYKERGYREIEIPEYILDCDLPEDGQEILIATKWGVDTDICSADIYDGISTEYYLEVRGDWEGVFAWAAMPKYKAV